MPSDKRTRFAYLSGPVNALDVYNAWAKRAQLEYFGTSYLTQFYQACADNGAEGYVITTLPGSYNSQQAGSFLIENRPTPSGLSGLSYHLGFCIWILKILPGMIRFRPDVLIITAGHNYWIFLSILKLFGVVIIPAIHDSLWKRFLPLKTSWRILRRLEALFFLCCVNETIVAAESTAEQVRALVPKKNIQIEVFLPTYPPQQFASIRSIDFNTRPFRILFMGRIETNKGVYDLVEIASLLDPQVFHFDVCGDGSELPSLRRTIEERGLNATLSCHGFLDRKELYALLDQVHVVIVPTTTDFEEGFNMVCAEAILYGRPVITSAVCPALAYIRDAAIEVPPNDVEKYREAVIRLATNPNLFEAKRDACKALQMQFYDPNNSWGAKLQVVLKKYVQQSPA
jgi:glycogen(starch) synthase